MLLWHKHDVEKSLADLANFTPFPDEWTVEDKVLFEQAFGFHGKCFQRIQQMVKPLRPSQVFLSPSGCDEAAPAGGCRVWGGPWAWGGPRAWGGPQPLALSFQLPDKLIPSLVKYYYSWKKTRSRTSVMDRQARRLGGRKDKEDRWGSWGPRGGGTDPWGGGGPGLCLTPFRAPVSTAMSLKRAGEPLVRESRMLETLRER